MRGHWQTDTFNEIFGESMPLDEGDAEVYYDYDDTIGSFETTKHMGRKLEANAKREMELASEGKPTAGAEIEVETEYTLENERLIKSAMSAANKSLPRVSRASTGVSSSSAAAAGLHRSLPAGLAGEYKRLEEFDASKRKSKHLSSTATHNKLPSVRTSHFGGFIKSPEAANAAFDKPGSRSSRPRSSAAVSSKLIRESKLRQKPGSAPALAPRETEQRVKRILDVRSNVIYNSISSRLIISHVCFI